jgi:TIR domain
VTQRLPQPAPGVPVFFLSYARADSDVATDSPERTGRDRHVWRFHEDLSGHVRQLLGSRAGADPGFIDHSMRGGEKWDNSILEAARTAAVFVALLSADYVESEWCAMEWDAFSRRPAIPRDGRDAGRQTTILPVLWSPVVDRRLLPKTVSDVQRFAPNSFGTDALRRSYELNGIYGLLVSNSPDYEAIVWHLALHLAYLFYTFEVPFGKELRVDQLRTEFREEGE